MNRTIFLRTLPLLVISVMTSLFVFASTPVLVSADSVSDGLSQLKDKAGDSLPTTSISDESTPSEIFAKIINVALGIGFAIAVIMVIYGGYQYIMSAGSEEKATSGRQTILYALLGMVIIIMSFVIVNAVVNFVSNNS